MVAEQATKYEPTRRRDGAALAGDSPGPLPSGAPVLDWSCTVRAAVVGAAAAAVCSVAPFGGIRAIALVGGMLFTLGVAVLVLLRQVIFAASDRPAARLERILRVALGREKPGPAVAPRQRGWTHRQTQRRRSRRGHRG